MRRALLSVTDKQGIVEFARGLVGARLRAAVDRRHRRALPTPGCSDRGRRLHRLPRDDGRAPEDAAPEGARRPARRAATTGAPGGDGSARHRPDRRAVRQPLPLPRDGAQARHRAQRDRRADRHRRAGDDPQRREEPPERRRRRRPGRLPGGAARAARARRQAAAGPAAQARREGVRHTAAYDAAIAQWFDCERRTLPGEPFFPARVAFSGEKLQDLRYGENPHQKGAFYTSASRARVWPRRKQLGGKELSYNNILDADAALAWRSSSSTPACVLVKHNNPCGTAVAATLPRAFELALAV
jgi:hypothetical protein